MKTLFVSLTLFIVATVSFGQTTLGLKVYQNTDHFNVTMYNREASQTRDDEVLNFDRISLAFSWKQKKWFQEVEVFIPEISRPVEKVKFPFEHEFREGYGVTSDVQSYSIRYEISRSLIGSSKRFDFQLGLGVNPYFIRTDYTPTISIMYSQYTTVTGGSVNLIPRINFKITDRILLDLNFPFKVYDLSERMTRVNNPSIPVRHQTTSETSNTFFDNVYTLRLGVEFILTK